MTTSRNERPTELSSLPRATASRLLREYGLPAAMKRLGSHPGVIHIGTGIKCKGGHHDYSRSLCIKVYVNKKRDTVLKHRIPRKLYVSHNKMRLVIPTDVEQIGPFLFQDHTTNAPTLESEKSGSCGFLARSQEDRFLVSAGHVVRSEPAPERHAKWSKNGRDGSGTTVLSWPRRIDDRNEIQGSVDSGLIRVDNAGPYNIDGLCPEASSTVSWTSAEQLRRVFICGRSGVVVAEYTARLPAGFRLDDGRKLWRIVKFQLGDAETQPGDSGAPILAGENRNTLVGIHIGIYTDPLNDVKYSVAHCAADILSIFSDEFGRAFEIIKPLNHV